MERISPKTDIIFKMIFGDPKHPNILIHFLNCVIKPKSPIENVEIENPNYDPKFIGDKSSRLDIVARTESGELLNIEIQRKDEGNMTARSLFYWSSMFSGQLSVSEDYSTLKRTICINVLDFNLFKTDDRYWRKNQIQDVETNEQLTDLLEIHFLELNKMKEVRKESPLTFWIEFLQDPYSEKVKSLCEFVPEIREAKEVYERAKSDPEARELIRLREKSTRDQVNAISTATKLGKAEGLAEGELKKARETAITMLKDGMPVNTVSKYTGLSTAEVEKLKQTGS